MAIFGALALFGSSAWAQSSGNFTYGTTGENLDCVLSSKGVISGGSLCYQGSCLVNQDCSFLSSTAECIGATSTTLGACEIPCATNSDCTTAPGLGFGGETCDGVTHFCTTGADGCGGSISAAIKTNSGSGNVFDIRPSAVIGLLTDVSLVKNSNIDVGTSSALAGVDVGVTVNAVGGSPANVCVTPDFGVTYDSRFVQISSNLFDVIASTCDLTSQTINGSAVTGCFFSFAESTVSAHSFDWIAGNPTGAQANCSNLSSGTYGITVTWTPTLATTGLSQALTCVGPVNVTVEQNKIFHFNQVN